MNRIEVYSTVDWFRWTSPYGTQLSDALPVNFERADVIEPLPYYNMAISLIPAGRLDWNTNNPKQGMSCNLSGGDLRTAEAQGMRADEIVANVTGKQYARVTRLDLAVDVLNASASPTDVLEAYKAGEMETRAKKIRQVIGYCEERQREGNTVYVGSRTGETYMRIYEKNLETIAKNKLRGSKNKPAEKELIATLQALDWTRVEVELKGKKAQTGARAVTLEGHGKAANAAIRRFCALPKVGWWNEMLTRLPSANLSLMAGENHHSSNSQRWLMEQALPAVIKAIKQENQTVIAEIQNALLDLDTKGYDFD